MALLTEPLIPRRCRFVDQIGVEPDPHGNSKGEARFQPRRIGSKRHVEMPADFCKIFDKIRKSSTVYALYPRHEPRILHAGHIAMKTACVANRE